MLLFCYERNKFFVCFFFQIYLPIEFVERRVSQKCPLGMKIFFTLWIMIFFKEPYEPSKSHLKI